MRWSRDAGLPGGQRPRRAADRRRPRGRRARHRAPRRVGGRDRARRQRLRSERLPVPRLSAAKRVRARCGVGRARRWPWPAVAFESPRRLPRTLRVPSRRPLPARPVAVCRELTKQFEEVVRGSRPPFSLARFATPPKGEITLVLGPVRRCRRPGRGTRAAGPSTSSSLRSRPPTGGRPGRPARRREPEHPLPAAHCDETVTRFDNGEDPSLSSFACCLRCERRLPSSSVSLAQPPAERLDMAGFRPGPAAVSLRRRPVRLRAAPRHRRRRRPRRPGSPPRDPAPSPLRASLPTYGLTVTIETTDGSSSPSCTSARPGHPRRARPEGQAIGLIGPSGTPEQSAPYVHLGIRMTGDPNGYLDPLAFLPARTAQPAGEAPLPTSPTPAAAPEATHDRGTGGSCAVAGSGCSECTGRGRTGRSASRGSRADARHATGPGSG